jgi:hypothetical protein
MGRRYWPPFVVTLGESGSLGEDLVKNITDAAVPMGVRELLKLDTGSAGEMFRSSHRFNTTYRVNNAVLNWSLFVEKYCAVAKLIVLDLRNESVHVDAECLILNENDWWYKVLIISKDGSGATGRVGGVKMNQDSIGKVPTFHEPSELCLAVSKIAKNRENMPSKERPTWRVLSLK